MGRIGLHEACINPLQGVCGFSLAHDQKFKTLNPKPLNPKPLNPKPLNPKPLNPKLNRGSGPQGCLNGHCYLEPCYFGHLGSAEHTIDLYGGFPKIGGP